MKLGYKVDMEKIPEKEEFPSGESVVAVTNISKKATKSGGWMYTAELTNDDGQKVYDNFVIGHTDPAVVDSFKQKLNRLAKACKIEGIFDDTDQLISRLCVIQVTHEWSKEYGNQPKVKKYLTEKTKIDTEEDDKPF